MQNNHAPLTVEEVTDQKELVREGWLPDLPRLFDTIEQQREQIAALKNRLVGTEAENGLLNTRYQNLQTDMEVLEKERDSLRAELQTLDRAIQVWLKRPLK